tara:strand:- start:23 stop:145 length:123 start_codon:yes stop_codon:yes gene_type:complete
MTAAAVLIMKDDGRPSNKRKDVQLEDEPCRLYRTAPDLED